MTDSDLLAAIRKIVSARTRGDRTTEALAKYDQIVGLLQRNPEVKS